MSEHTGDTPGPSKQTTLFEDLPPSLQAHLATPIPDPLWHYTSMKAMQAILDHGEMYATDARFLNDSAELVHAAEFADRLIQSQPHPPEVIDFVRRHVADWFNVFLSLRNPFRNYVSCFTSRKDDLSQWRAYSGGSTGASMAFDLRDFHDLAPCVYRDEDKKRLLEGIFAEMFYVGNMHFNADLALLLPPRAKLDPELEAEFPGSELNVIGAAGRLLAPILKILPLFKDGSFEAENEWRIVRLASESVAENSIFYRPRMDSLVPTIKVDIKGREGRVPLTGLILGPGSHPSACDAVTRYLGTKGIAIESERSAVPYRTTTS